MKIGIDISQLVYEGTGVAEYLGGLVEKLVETDKHNEYVLFFSSMRRGIQNSKFKSSNRWPKIKIRRFPFPPTLLDIIWNKLHILPIELFIGDVDVFLSSDWTQPPSKRAKMITIIYDLIVYKYPQETAKKIIQTQKRRLKWVKDECAKIICISESTKKDAIEILGIEPDKINVVYPGIKI